MSGSADRISRGSPDDESKLIAAQLGRAPRGSWRVAVRCTHGFPSVIVTAPVLGASGTPFPTLYWVTCPWLVRGIDDLESEGGCDRWGQRLAEDPGLTRAMQAADAEYRLRRSAESPGTDPSCALGIAGQRDPFATKCLHAHAGAYLAGINDPIGSDVIETIGRACADKTCERLALAVG